jgi:hypothetical protein
MTMGKDRVAGPGMLFDTDTIPAGLGTGTVPACSSKSSQECSFHPRGRSVDRHLAETVGMALNLKSRHHYV